MATRSPASRAAFGPECEQRVNADRPKKNKKNPDVIFPSGAGLLVCTRMCENTQKRLKKEKKRMLMQTELYRNPTISAATKQNDGAKAANANST